ncbi:MAG TPA: hypothetical protein VLE27_08490 [Thermoanaerobaculia bacterium]|nr:hypothetical protein [Thermoanaerobaculia bacterium]
MPSDERLKFEASLSEPDEEGPVRLYVWIRHFQGGDETTGRYEIFEDLDRLDEFILRAESSGQDTAELRSARERFAESLGQAT